jgi:hypothetical protein
VVNPWSSAHHLSNSREANVHSFTLRSFHPSIMNGCSW